MYAPFLFSTSEQELHYVLLHRKGIDAFPMHWHDEIEITYVEKGEVRLFLNSECLTLGTGDSVIINSGDCHYFFPSDAETVSVLFSPDILSGTPDSGKIIEDVKARLSRNSRTTAFWSAEEKARLKSILDELGAVEKGTFSYELLVRSALFRLVALIAGEHPGHEAVCSDDNGSIKVRKRIGNVFRFIEEHYMDQVSLPEAAAASGYVPTYFSRVFKASTGMTFYDYLTIFRIRKAEAELINTRSSIAAIAVSVGFSSVKTFDRVFKEQIGISPLKFRKQHVAGSGGKHRKKSGS